jgi:hypothetical protein
MSLSSGWQTRPGAFVCYHRRQVLTSECTHYALAVHRCTREEAIWYLDKRQAAGYNVVMAVILTEHDGLTTPNMYKEYIFHAGEDGQRTDPSRINEKYFEHVDWVIEQAANRGLTMCLVPSWGKYFNGVRPSSCMSIIRTYRISE